VKVILVTGGRAYRDQGLVNAALSEESPDLVIHGGAKSRIPATGLFCGADYYAGMWARCNNRCELCAPADWSLGGKAGPIRNSAMIDMLSAFRAHGYDCTVMAFFGGTGTADTVRKAKAAGFPLIYPADRFVPSAVTDDDL